MGMGAGVVGVKGVLGVQVAGRWLGLMGVKGGRGLGGVGV